LNDIFQFLTTCVDLVSKMIIVTDFVIVAAFGWFLLVLRFFVSFDDVFCILVKNDVFHRASTFNDLQLPPNDLPTTSQRPPTTSQRPPNDLPTTSQRPPNDFHRLPAHIFENSIKSTSLSEFGMFKHFLYILHCFSEICADWFGFDIKHSSCTIYALSTQVCNHLLCL
jgi:hypothetical protein